MIRTGLFASIVFIAALSNCDRRPSWEGATGLHEGPLASVSKEGQSSLEAILNERRSIRGFAVTPLPSPHIAQILWAAYGITSEDGKRTTPSAGRLYPLRIYAVDATGHYRYESEEHALLKLGSSDLRPSLMDVCDGQTAIVTAPLVLILAGSYSMTAETYGEEKAPMYVHLECGHATQNLLLQATALGVHGVPIAGMDSAKVQELIKLPKDFTPLYAIPLGYSR